MKISIVGKGPTTIITPAVTDLGDPKSDGDRLPVLRALELCRGLTCKTKNSSTLVSAPILEVLTRISFESAEEDFAVFASLDGENDAEPDVWISFTDNGGLIISLSVDTTPRVENLVRSFLLAQKLPCEKAERRRVFGLVNAILHDATHPLIKLGKFRARCATPGEVPRGRDNAPGRPSA